MPLRPAVPADGPPSTSLGPDSTAGSTPCGAALAVPADAAGPGSDHAAPPLVDPAALRDLSVQLDSPAAAKGFARDYAKMWDRRYNSLASALDRRDQAAALESVLSLKTSSAMVGGVQLTQLAGELEDAVRSGDMDLARSLLGVVGESGSETVDELQLSCVLWDN